MVMVAKRLVLRLLAILEQVPLYLCGSCSVLPCPIWILGLMATNLEQAQSFGRVVLKGNLLLV